MTRKPRGWSSSVDELLRAWRDCGLNLLRNCLAQLTLQFKHIVSRSLEPFGPEMGIRSSVDQLGGDADLLAIAHYRALDDPFDV